MRLPYHGVLHPVSIVALAEVLAGVCAAGLLARLRRQHGAAGVGQQVTQLQGLDEVRVPDERTVGHAHLHRKDEEREGGGRRTS